MLEYLGSSYADQNMESFSILVDLTSFFDDFRGKSVVLVNTESMTKVKHVEKHIKTLFGIDSDTNVFSLNNFVPGAEDSRILKGLSSIRLESSSISSSKEYMEASEYENGNEKHEESVSTYSKTRNVEETPTVDQDEISDIGYSQKKKKHKRKRVDNVDVTQEYSATQQGVSDDHSSISLYVNTSGAGKVRQTANSTPKHLHTEASSWADSYSVDGRKMIETPNKVFYNNVYKEAHKNAQQMVEEWRKKSGGSGGEYGKVSDANITDTDNITDKTARDNDADDSNPNTDASSYKPKRKRIRKRKNTAKLETLAKDIETLVPQMVSPSTSVMSRSSNRNSKHTYFPEDGEDSQPSVKMTEELKRKTGDANGSTMLEFPDNDAEETKEEDDRYRPSTLKDPVNSRGTDILPTASLPMEDGFVKPRSYSAKARGSLGALLSLVRSEDPQVFERKKAVKNDEAAAARQELDTPKVSKPTSKTPNEIPSTPMPPPTSVTPLPNKDLNSGSTAQSEVALIPLITVPEVKMKISFRILKMSPSYCPELSAAIIAVVEEVNPNTRELTLKILSGAEECQKPKGKFDLLDPTVTYMETAVDEIKLNWDELIEPSLFP